MTAPIYCPNCGKIFHGKNALVECADKWGQDVWDCYCIECGWSGDISPDEISHNILRRMKVKMEKEK